MVRKNMKKNSKAKASDAAPGAVPTPADVVRALGRSKAAEHGIAVVVAAMHNLPCLDTERTMLTSVAVSLRSYLTEEPDMRTSKRLPHDPTRRLAMRPLRFSASVWREKACAKCDANPSRNRADCGCVFEDQVLETDDIEEAKRAVEREAAKPTATGAGNVYERDGYGDENLRWSL
jgi:hypothetical protein